MSRLVFYAPVICFFLVGLWFIGPSYSEIFAFSFVIILTILYYPLRYWKLNKLPKVNDEEFMYLFKAHFNKTDKIVLKERKRIAIYFIVPYDIISPLDSFERLCSWGEYDVALDDLEEEMIELFESKGLDTKYSLPETIGEYIVDLIEVKK